MAGPFSSRRRPPDDTEERAPAVVPDGDDSRSRGGSVAAIKSRAEETRRQLESRRSKSPWVDTAFRSVQLHNESGGALLAGAIAFRFFLFLVPFVFVFVMGLGIGANLSNTDVRDVARQAGIAGVAASAIRSGADASGVTQWVTFALASVALVTGARNLAKVLRVSHALIWRERLRKPRYPAFAGLGLIFGITLVLVLVRVIDAARDFSFITWLVGLALLTVLPALGWMYYQLRYLPKPADAGWSNVWPGALLFGIGLQGLHLATILWVAPSTASKSETYGAIGAALTILAWAYLLGRVVTATAALNASLWRGSAATRAAASSDTEVPAARVTPD